MFQRIASLLFGEDTDSTLVEPKPFLSETEDDGWLIIDLPGPGPVTVESSPLEDLLIEHPSMSVYVTSSILMEGESPTEQSTDGAVTQTIVERRAPHHPTSITAKATILEKVNHVCRIQRAKELVERRKLSRKSIQRQNYTRERRPRWAKQNGPFVYQPCNRQYNY
ncbi:tumor protein p53-inducible nuclear protein 2 isoform X3 [Microcaecilia unicolor]|uniref:Tumor protein p53-inducible nuclear protein 2 isoform X3 n=1 Tax=Microcaecilia unicolor TaxID=1415580 RepID=A0A6P7YVD7_9AMPH|nr:tumor protein p53-inducible nuclear protein 2 isoform X3 [Microcaecilia unicolor]